MKVFIIGIAGRTGSRLAAVLKERGDEVVGMARRLPQIEKLASEGIDATLGDIGIIEAGLLADMVRGVDAIVFTAGAGDADDEAKTDAIDGDGVSRTIAAAKDAGVRRVYLVSAFPEAWRERETDKSFEHYIEVKKKADVELAASELDWVILRPSVLLDDPGKGKVTLSFAQFHTEIARDDVAATLSELIHTPAVNRVILELTSGSTSIPDAVGWVASQTAP
jgi:uncharacterized protein YbjT (DUF2867 family)